jgi:pyridoxine 5-phosphate synthase
MTMPLRLGVNIDHVATIRNARGGIHPDPVDAAKIAVKAGADGITAHLREDRRHISDNDITRLCNEIDKPLNFEMAATDEMLEIALGHVPHAACIVPEKRVERTTEGGLDVVSGHNRLMPYVDVLGKSGIRVSVFIEPDIAQIDGAKALGVPVIEMHVGAYCSSTGVDQEKEFARIVAAAAHAEKIGLECHAGHGITFDTVASVAAIQSIAELNIGHFIIGEAIFTGLEDSIHSMRKLMNKARASS